MFALIIPNPWTCFPTATIYRKGEIFLLQLAFAIEGKNQASVNRTRRRVPRVACRTFIRKSARRNRMRGYLILRHAKRARRDAGMA
jgi:hypothetical protein